MATNKVTFTLDAETVHRIEDAAERLAKPKSQIVREAVADYHGRMGVGTGRLSESEIQKRLEIFDTMIALIPSRPQREVDAELKEIRRARRSGGRLTRSE
jgi:predicted transcriptional regulator